MQKGSHLRQLWSGLSILATVLVLAVPAAGSPIHRSVAVGDLHGDFAAWQDITRAAQLVNNEGHWVGGDSVLVQTGDVVDRGPDSLKIIQNIMQLQSEALRAHGQVIALIGNHEAMNLTDDLRYVSAADFSAYADEGSARLRDSVYAANRTAIEMAYRQRDPKMTSDAIRQAWFVAYPLGRLEHQLAWSDHGKIGQWIAKNPAVVLLDDTLFVHGGISPSYVQMPIAEINREVTAALKARTTDLKAIINDPVGPLWYRGLATPNADAEKNASSGTAEAAADTAPLEPPVEDQLERILSDYGAKRIVIGHTPTLSGIALLYGGRLICIDTGISQVYGGKVSYLDILDGVPTPHAIERSTPTIKQGAP